MLSRIQSTRHLSNGGESYSRVFVEEKLGERYVENRTIEFAKSFEESGPTTPVFFILSSGVDPLKDVEALGRKLGYTFENQKFHNVSLGQGQEPVADRALEIAAERGHWVILQVCTLINRESLHMKIHFSTEHSSRQELASQTGKKARSTG